ncbi:hypothetical protein SCP_0204760 [Sparassis crispa]|uniref:Helicase ATP-binding domain-containing protein n=1 Tax=Sparassis crispa TaxID=139825 RepID=A0A401GAT2_9APHY|nr:hypothetical protein SCP_0204760 [Sparassis crispa]GBE79278.1 hypothetical protein SCP_0204760 [Sparassis crispa]
MFFFRGVGHSFMTVFDNNHARLDGPPVVHSVRPGPPSAEINALKHELRKSKAEAEVQKQAEERLKDHGNKLQEKVKILQDKIETMGIEDRHVHSAFRRLEDNDLRQKDSLNRIREELQRTAQLSSGYKHELAILQKKHEDVLALLHIRTSELHEAQQFLSKPDDTSDAEVMRTVEKLDAEIYQIAAQIANTVQFSRDQRMQPHLVDQLAEDAGLADILGLALVQLLKSKQHHEDPICVQIALQACMSQYAAWMIQTWDFKPRGEQRLIEKIYAGIIQDESQTVSARWRVLTRSYLRTLVDEGTMTHWLQCFLIGHISDVLRVSGLTDDPRELCQAVERLFGKQMRSIVKLSLDIREAAGERIMSGNVEAIVIKAGTPFDQQQMEDAFAEERDVKDKESVIRDLVKAKFNKRACLFQIKVAQALMERQNDVVAIAATGFGKTLSFWIPLLMALEDGEDKLIIIVTPLNILGKQNVNLLQRANIQAMAIDARNATNEVFEDVQAGKYQVVVLNPEIIMEDDGHCEKLWKKPKFTLKILHVIFDEGHCVKEWSAFREQYKHVGALRYLIPETIPFYVASATLPSTVLLDVGRMLQLREGCTEHIIRSNDRPNIAISVRKMQLSARSFEDLNFLIPEDFKDGDPPPSKFLIFFDNIKEAEAAVKHLRSRLPEPLRDKIKHFRSIMMPEYRDDEYDALKNSDIFGLCVTDSFGMGLDLPDILLIIQ